MQPRSEEAARDRAIFIVRLATFGSLAGALGLTWLCTNLAEAFFSGRAPAAQLPPTIPLAAAPVQAAPPVIRTVVHHAGYPPSSGAAARMPFDAVQALLSRDFFLSMGTTNTVVVDDPAILPQALAIVREQFE